jgi:hypothetical protein
MAHYYAPEVGSMRDGAPFLPATVYFEGVQRDIHGRELAYFFTDGQTGSTISVPLRDPYSMHERIRKCRKAFKDAEAFMNLLKL